MALVLEALWSDETLDLGGLGIWFRILLLGLDFTADDELADLYRETLSARDMVLRLNQQPHGLLLAGEEE